MEWGLSQVNNTPVVDVTPAGYLRLIQVLSDRRDEPDDRQSRQRKSLKRG